MKNVMTSGGLFGLTLYRPEIVLASAHPWNWNKTKPSTVGSFVLFQFYFTMCDGL